MKDTLGAGRGIGFQPVHRGERGNPELRQGRNWIHSQDGNATRNQVSGRRRERKFQVSPTKKATLGWPFLQTNPFE